MDVAKHHCQILTRVLHASSSCLCLVCSVELALQRIRISPERAEAWAGQPFGRFAVLLGRAPHSLPVQLLENRVRECARARACTNAFVFSVVCPKVSPLHFFMHTKAIAGPVVDFGILCCILKALSESACTTEIELGLDFIIPFI